MVNPFQLTHPVEVAVVTGLEPSVHIARVGETQIPAH
jgi:hypothetical protein